MEEDWKGGYKGDQKPKKNDRYEVSSQGLAFKV
jgi:hypothetical protein